MKTIILNYTEYNLWANQRMAEMLRENVAQIDAEVKSSFPSMRKTMHHIWGAEELWYKRLHGESLPKVPGWDFAGGFEEASKLWLEISGKFSLLLKSNDQTWLNASCTYKDTRGNTWTNPHWQMIHHCMNHSTYHRGQLITMLRETGATKILDTDQIVYFREKN